MKVFVEDPYVLKWQEGVWLVGSKVLSGLDCCRAFLFIPPDCFPLSPPLLHLKLK